MSITFFEDEQEDEPDPEPGYGLAKRMVAVFLAIVLGCLVATGMALWGPSWD